MLSLDFHVYSLPLFLLFSFPLFSFQVWAKMWWWHLMLIKRCLKRQHSIGETNLSLSLGQMTYFCTCQFLWFWVKNAKKLFCLFLGYTMWKYFVWKYFSNSKAQFQYKDCCYCERSELCGQSANSSWLQGWKLLLLISSIYSKGQ